MMIQEFLFAHTASWVIWQSHSRSIFFIFTFSRLQVLAPGHMFVLTIQQSWGIDMFGISENSIFKTIVVRNHWISWLDSCKGRIYRCPFDLPSLSHHPAISNQSQTHLLPQASMYRYCCHRRPCRPSRVTLVVRLLGRCSLKTGQGQGPPCPVVATLISQQYDQPASSTL
jgi:hypothetical protein